MSRVVLVLGLDSSRRIDILGCAGVDCVLYYTMLLGERGRGRGLAGWLTLYGVGSLEKRISAFGG
jgi:hypothetical protein